MARQAAALVLLAAAGADALAASFSGPRHRLRAAPARAPQHLIEACSKPGPKVRMVVPGEWKGPAYQHPRKSKRSKSKSKLVSKKAKTPAEMEEEEQRQIAKDLEKVRATVERETDINKLREAAGTEELTWPLGSMLALWSWPWVLYYALLWSGFLPIYHPTMQNLQTLLTVCSRLLVAAGCGALIGVERKDADRPAGLRSMTLVSSGSAVYVLACTFGLGTGDPNRAAAQVCTGVGFIGAGVIAKGNLRDPVRGVTTACAVWVAAGVGVVAATGMHLFALYSCGLTITVLRISRWYNAIVRGRLSRMLQIHLPELSND